MGFCPQERSHTHFSHSAINSLPKFLLASQMLWAEVESPWFMTMSGFNLMISWDANNTHVTWQDLHGEVLQECLSSPYRDGTQIQIVLLQRAVPVPFCASGGTLTDFLATYSTLIPEERGLLKISNYKCRFVFLFFSSVSFALCVLKVCYWVYTFRLGLFDHWSFFTKCWM